MPQRIAAAGLGCGIFRLRHIEVAAHLGFGFLKNFSVAPLVLVQDYTLALHEIQKKSPSTNKKGQMLQSTKKNQKK